MKDLILVEEQEAEFLTRVHLFGLFSTNHLIHSVETYAEADRKITEGEHIKKAIEEKLDPIVSERHKAHKAATKFRYDLIYPIENCSQILMDKMKAYQRYQDEKQAAEKKKLEDEATARQEKECWEQAEELEKAGADKKTIDAVLELANDPIKEVHIATPILRSKTSFKQSWDIEVLNEDEVPDQYIIKTVNIKAIKQIVKDKKGNIGVPGIRIFETTSTRRSSR